MSWSPAGRTVEEHMAHPRDGEQALDSATGQVGIICGQVIKRLAETDDVVGRKVWLRPVRGGFQWDTDPGCLGPVGKSES